MEEGLTKMNAFTKFIEKLDDHFAKVASVCIMINIVVILINVFGRVLFGQPFRGQYDIVSVLFVVICVTTISYAEKEKRHVRIDILMQALGRRGKIVLHTFLGILTLGVSVLIPYGMYNYMFSTWERHDTTMTTNIPYFPFVVVAFVAFIFFVCSVLLNFLHAYKEWRAE